MLRVFLLDDDDNNRMTLSVLLEDDGFEVTTASSFAEAEALLSGAVEFDLFLLDHALGDGFGTDLIPTIRARFPTARIVTISGSLGGDLASETADLVLAKAMHFPTFAQKLRDVARK